MMHAVLNALPELSRVQPARLQWTSALCHRAARWRIIPSDFGMQNWIASRTDSDLKLELLQDPQGLIQLLERREPFRKLTIPHLPVVGEGLARD